MQENEVRHHPPTPYLHYLLTWGALILMTFLTVMAAHLHFGKLNTAMSLAIATTKATLVVLFFMHLRQELRAAKVTFIVTLVTLGIFLIGVYTDVIFLQMKGQ